MLPAATICRTPHPFPAAPVTSSTSKPAPSQPAPDRPATACRLSPRPRTCAGQRQISRNVVKVYVQWRWAQSQRTGVPTVNGNSKSVRQSTYRDAILNGGRLCCADLHY